MKDIYELLNDMDVDSTAEDIMPVSEIEKKKVVNHVKQRMVTSKKQSNWKRSLLSAIVTVGILFSTMIGLSFTTYAEDIPFLGNIFKFFSTDGSYDGYDDQADQLNLVQESNGIRFKINDTVFDGRSLYITYTMETSKDLGDTPWVNSMPHFANTGLGGSEQVSKIEEGKYVGVISVDHYVERDLEEIDVDWKIESISTEPNNEGTVFKGDWEFQFSVQAVESQEIVLNEILKTEGVTVTFESLKITPMSIILLYEHVAEDEIKNDWDALFITVEVKDDLGNSYPAQSITGYGDPSYGESWFATYKKMDPDATKLILTPIIELSDMDTIGYDENGEPIKADYRTVDSDADYREIQLKDIIIDLK